MLKTKNTGVENPLLVVLLYKILKGSFKMRVRAELSQAFIKWQMERGWPRICCHCDERIKAGQKSLEHLIPVSICMELNLPQLIFDPRNFEIAHVRCNLERSNRIDDLPEAVQLKISQLRATSSKSVRV